MPHQSRNADAARVSAEEIRHRLAGGALIREYPGVYRVGHQAPSTDASYLAAVRACGNHARLSGLAAAWHWALVKGRPPPPEVSSPTERKVKGLRTRHRRLHPIEVTAHRGIPITSVPLTLIDISPSLAPDNLARACHEAGVRYRTTPRMVEQCLARRPNTPGAAKLRAILRGDTKVTLSALGSRFLSLPRAHSLPLPTTNKPAGAHRVDCRWPAYKLTVELDSYRYHSSRHAWEADRSREREAHARGDDLRRYTWGDVFEEPRLMMGELRGLLGGR